MFFEIELTHTPGVVYAFAYWLTTVMYVRFCGVKNDGKRQRLMEAVFLIFLSVFMYATDGVSQIFFVIGIIIIGLMICTFVYMSLRCSLCTVFYVYIRAYILGEFTASFAWQLYYFCALHAGVPKSLPAMTAFIVLVYAVILTAVYAIEKRYGSGAVRLDMDTKRLMPAIFIGLITFIVSNLSFVVRTSPFSSTLPAEIFIIRTMTDLAGVGLLFAHSMFLNEMETRIEVDTLQRMLEMQYTNYQVAEESIALVNQKYHDLKHQIAILRSDIQGEEKERYLDQLENDIRQFETLNKTGNDILDTILTSKSMVFQKAGIRLTTVADGAALDFMNNMDISALFGNALDNAMDGVMQLQEETERLIHLTVSNQKGFLRIVVENRFDGNVEFANGMPKTTKGDTSFHGFGVKSMKSIAEKYGGSLRISAENGWFKVGVLIPRPGKA